MDQKYEHLFAPGKIGNLTIKNRIVMAPAMTGFPGLDGEVGNRLIGYYEERAKGGVGAVIVEAGTIDECHSLGRYNQIYYQPKAAAGLERLCEALHRYDTKVFAQLWHGGNTCDPEMNHGVIYSASDVPVISGWIPHPLSKEEITALVERYAAAAGLCKKVGFDGVEVHAAHGYLIAQFLSRHFNRRTDEYGGSFENRVRFLDEILRAVRDAVGPGYPVSVRFSADEMASDYDEDHMTLEDGLRLAKHLDGSGLVDVLNVSYCNRLTPNANCDPYFYESGWKARIAKQIKDAVSCPVMSTNTVKSPEDGERQLAEGASDFVLLGRGLIADPHFAKKARQGRGDEIFQCIGCLLCRESMGGAGMLCSVNPCAGYETEYRTFRQDGAGRAVAVIGGGPAGMKAAWVLAKRGFSVKLYEREQELGGTLNLADQPSHKGQLTRLNRTLQRHLTEAGVAVSLGTEATPELLRRDGTVGVFLATGAIPVVPPIEGIDLSHVFLAEQVIRDHLTLSGHVAVIGSGLTGLEVAEMLARKGSKVTIVEMRDQLGPGIYSEIMREMSKELNGYRLNVHTGSKLVSIKTGKIQVEEVRTGATKWLEADAVVLAMGVRPQPGLEETFRQAFDQVVVIGDAGRGGRIYQAIKEGFCKAFVFEP